MNYLIQGTTDSRDPGSLSLGEFSEGGEIQQGALDVIVENPEFTIPREESTTAQFSAQFISTVDLGRAVTSLARLD